MGELDALGLEAPGPPELDGLPQVHEDVWWREAVTLEVAATDAGVLVRLHDLVYDACDPVELDCPRVFHDAEPEQGALLIQPLVVPRQARVLDSRRILPTKTKSCATDGVSRRVDRQEGGRGANTSSRSAVAAPRCASFLDLGVTLLQPWWLVDEHPRDGGSEL